MKKILLLVLLSILAFGKEFYTDTKEVSDPNDLLVVVNKFNYLPKDYKPSDLIYIDGAYGNKVPIRSILKDDFLVLQTAAKNEIGIKLMPTTAFRDQNFQKTLYDKYVKKDGVKAADTYSARPGYSEHQTGLAIDLKNMALKNARLSDENYKWLEENAHKYGFIVRFPKGKEQITGYKFENWHIRYVGKNAAKEIMDNNLTLEEYVDLNAK
ncbi:MULTISPECIES: M15 family metallopeptidase [unclassified Campylobacter]|uniref:M15 family metallopeptidase n=1 Tax=unclassified Campylobacter TaxID=2593542 RepID=UPI0022EA09ED|nr:MULTISPECIES: M15 family metallopeptidase [unclassified Campylobacter]MDA3080166.1 M15 family metallopeptidase [Campylobacter sp. CS_NA2]MDA3081613.1 M15 family metallopeptidase [Campylobacter sp. CS_NA1]MDA3086223.1 M15 family metallopeptidase [Campylobacter sp. CS_ED1]MDA3090828.1 M15 family metallopeptidase [Campylobacter sp. CS_ED2]WBR51101.1 M15 family metallopeptidase [Campylobacter sp. CS_NA3]